MTYGKNILNKFRFGGIRRLVLDALAKTGIKIFLYYRILERVHAEPKLSMPNSFDDYEFGLLNECDMAEMASMPLRNSDETESELQQRLQEGMQCIGAKHRGRIVSYVWYRMDYLELMGELFPLKPDEAYMFDVFTVMDYRGKGLAAQVGHRLYQRLRKDGCTKLQSITNVFNTPYLLVKKKLNAQIIAKGLLIILLGRFRYHRILKTAKNSLYPMLTCFPVFFHVLSQMDQC